MSVPYWAISRWRKDHAGQSATGYHFKAEAIEAAFEGEYKVEGLEQTTIPDENRTPAHFFLEEVDGEVYPIPREVVLDGVSYRHMEDGTLIAEGARISLKGQVNTRSVIHPGAIIDGIVTAAEIGSNSHVGDMATVNKSVIGRDSTIGDQAFIFGLILPDGETISPGQGISPKGISTKGSDTPEELPASYKPFFPNS